MLQDDELLFVMEAASVQERGRCMPAFIKMLDHENEDVRDQSVRLLCGSGELMSPSRVTEWSSYIPAIGALLQGSERARLSALQLLRLVSAKDRHTYMQFIGDCLADADSRVRAAALRVLEACSADERAPYVPRFASTSRLASGGL
jgi:hypothetical protein